MWVGITHAMDMGEVGTIKLKQGSQSEAQVVCLHEVEKLQQTHKGWVGS